ncbi:MAG: galactose-1-phosphate uridylyltransferase, partial [Deltaproteobacteria bacterium]
MPELRKDPVTGRWVIIATERAKRPSDFLRDKVEIKGSGFCPFCYGNESKTPPEILAYRQDGSQRNSPGWTLRVVPNKFPALGIEGTLSRQGEGLYDKMHGIGAHEVIIETPEHALTLATLPVNRVEDVLWAFRDRILDLKKDKRFKYILIFKNHGEAAGASLEHPHSQLIALPVVPKRVLEEVDGAKEYFSFKERCIFCDIIRQEEESKIRVITENSEFIALAPFAPRFPFEMWLIPKVHRSSFEESQKNEFAQLAELLR